MSVILLCYRSVIRPITMIDVHFTICVFFAYSIVTYFFFYYRINSLCFSILINYDELSLFRINTLFFC